jgi:hypothetical protein
LSRRGLGHSGFGGSGLRFASGFSSFGRGFGSGVSGVLSGFGSGFGFFGRSFGGRLLAGGDGESGDAGGGHEQLTDGHFPKSFRRKSHGVMNPRSAVITCL